MFLYIRSLSNDLYSRPSNQLDLEDVVMVFTSLAIGVSAGPAG